MSEKFGSYIIKQELGAGGYGCAFLAIKEGEETLRKAIKYSSLRYIVSMRATINSTKLLEIGMTKKEVLKSVIIKNMQIDDINTIYNKINDNSEWTKLLGEFKNVSV